MDNVVFRYQFPQIAWALESIKQFSPYDYEMLLNEVTGDSGYSHDADRCRKLSSKLKEPFSAHEVFDLLTTLQFLYDRFREWEKTEKNAQKAFLDFLSLADLEKQFLTSNENAKVTGDEAIQRIINLTVSNNTIERRREIQFLQTGLIDCAVDFSAFIDLRPRMDKLAKEITDFVPAIIFQVTTEDDYGDNELRTFQITLKGLQRLRKVLSEVDENLSALINYPSIGEKLYNSILTDKEVQDE